MGYDPDIHHRRSIRFKGYDYGSVGAYYVTLCTENNLHLFGEIIDGQMLCNDAGKMIHRWYVELEHKFSDLRCDAFVCMPNHVQFIVMNGEKSRTSGAGEHVSIDEIATKGEHIGSPLRIPMPRPGMLMGTPLKTVVQWFKTMTTNDYLRGVKHKNWPHFVKKCGSEIITNILCVMIMISTKFVIIFH